MGVVDQQIEKAEVRALGVDMSALVEQTRDAVPRDIASSSQKRDRLSFLQQSLYDPKLAQGVYERIIDGNDLLDVNYLPRGEIAARAVARIAIKDLSGRHRGWATGFLIAPRVLITNHHVFPSADAARNSEAQFEAENSVFGEPKQKSNFRLHPADLFYANETLDFSVVAVDDISYTTQRPLSDFGFLPLVGRTGKVADGEWLSIIQHPNGELKQLCIRENKLIQRTDDALWYSTDTLGGSSGSPVCNNDWYVVALHHCGIPQRKNDVIQTVDGNDYDPVLDPDGARIKWIANEGVRVSRIVAQLQAALPTHPLVHSVLSNTADSTRPDPPRDTHLPVAPPTANPKPSLNNLESPMSIGTAQTIQFTLHIDSDGKARLGESVPYAGAAREAFRPSLEASKKQSGGDASAKFDVPFDLDYSKRKGYDEGFLGGKVVVHLPELSLALKKVAAPLLGAAGGNKFVLKYNNYSLVMNAPRRFAMYSAANVRADQRFNMGRPTDVWRTDPRIAIEHQITDFYYKKNQFDRGHLTRREDLEFGTTALAALASAADTCHWSNCTPQHSKFNQNKQLWQGIERHLLEGAITTDQYNAQLFTGPVLDEDDPVYNAFPKIQYPVRFWKVVSTLRRDGTLFATAYVLDQSEVIAQFGIESTEEIPFGAYKTFQVKIAEIVRLTGLTFEATINGKKHSLSDFDPLERHVARSVGRRRSFSESAEVSVPDGYVLLGDVDDIVMGSA